MGSYVADREGALEAFAQDFAPHAVDENEEGFRLSAGGISRWLMDAKRGVGRTTMLRRVGDLMLDVAEQAELLDSDVFAGVTMGGVVLLDAMCGRLRDERDPERAEIQPKDIPGSRYGRGVHGLKVIEGKTFLVIEDMVTTAASLIKSIDLVREHGGNVEDAMAFANRGGEQGIQALGDIGVRLHTLYDFREAYTLTPSAPNV
jgi:orotate phosphoribosyltransferase